MGLATDISAGQSGHVEAHRMLHRHDNATVWASDYGNDGLAIQAAIDAASNAGLGSVYVSAGRWEINETIQCMNGVDLTLDRQAILYLMADVDGISPSANCTLSGGALNCEGVDRFTHSAIAVDGNKKISMRKGLTTIRNILLVGPGTGMGLLMKALGTDYGYLAGIRIRDLNINHFQVGVLMDAHSPPETETNFINGNVLDGMWIKRCPYGLWMIGTEAGGRGIVASNSIVALIYQADDQSVNAIRLEGISKHNLFTNCKAFDWMNEAPDGADCLYLDEYTFWNRIVFDSNCDETHVNDQGTENTIINACQYPLGD